MYKLRLKASAFAMSYLSNEEKVRAQVRSLHPRTEKPAPFLGAGGVKVSAVCFKPKLYKSIRDYIAHMNSYVAAAAASGSQLIAFPELCGMTAISIMPGFATLYDDLENPILKSNKMRYSPCVKRCRALWVRYFTTLFHNWHKVTG